MRTGYSYIRFSTPDQLRGDSYRRQLDQSVEYAAQQNIELDTTLDLNDLGVSAFNFDGARYRWLAPNASESAITSHTACVLPLPHNPS